MNVKPSQLNFRTIESSATMSGANLLKFLIQWHLPVIPGYTGPAK